MLGIAVNAVTILLGSLLGLLFKNNIPKKITDAVMVGIGFFTVYLGVIGLTDKVQSIVCLLAVIFGGVLGTVLKIDEKINTFATKVQKRMSKGDGSTLFAAGFVGFFLMSAVGAYTIVASFHAGLGDCTMLYTKSVMDLIVSMAMASSLGIGVLFGGIPILLYEVLLVCFSEYLSVILSETMINALSCMGAILTLAIGLNVAGVTKFKVVNYVPSLVLAPLFAFLSEMISK